MVETVFEVDDISLFRRICGFNDKNIRKIGDLTGVSIIPRGNTLIINADREQGEKTLTLLHVMSDLLNIKEKNAELDDFDLNYLTMNIFSGKNLRADDIHRLRITLPDSGKTVFPKTINQANYINSIFNKPVTFSTGPAGTGKTFLAVVMALKMFLSGKVERIILTRPAVEAGESLGFLPGDLVQKINPYLRPLYDALFDMQPMEKIARLIEKGSIEIAPLAYMRGRTLNNAFIILDEAQNTTIAQMKMFLTRLGNNSRMVISGDDTQIDLEKPKKSGLIHARKILHSVQEIGFIAFSREDIFRHPVVEKIVEAYEKSGYTE